MDTSERGDAKKWFLSYGNEAKVLEPEELREEIIDELKSFEYLWRGFKR
ncbi:MAG: WYL domain-containing protein [Thermodesulfobacteriota bacterium]|jgi:predicted DNA-binding transcriptional regulator YafY